MLQAAKEEADLHICGIITDDVASKWINPLISNYEERKKVIEQIRYVDEVCAQDTMNPTANLKAIHMRFPKAKILLMQSHHMGGTVLGASFVKKIGGDVVDRNFYENLSRETIATAFHEAFSSPSASNSADNRDIKLVESGILANQFTTKANTLVNLKNRLKNAHIEKEYVLTVAQWNNDPKSVIASIQNSFKGNVVIRSSSLNEDSVSFSNAGFYDSILNVDVKSPGKIRNAIKKVVLSYTSAKDDSEENQILVQKQTDNIAYSGVIFTRNLWTNNPYYLINYDTSGTKTDGVTGGTANNKIEIFRDIKASTIDEPWNDLLQAVQEIETFFEGIALDIEFAIKRTGKIVIFQVRPLAANSKFWTSDKERVSSRIFEVERKYRDLPKQSAKLKRNVCLSDMAFWNPAELIGDRPNTLDYTLFNHLIMKSNWNSALVQMGYSKVEGGLISSLANKPYIIVPFAIECLLPNSLSQGLRQKLHSQYLKKLKENPQIHDKVEFELIDSCLDFNFERRIGELKKAGLSNKEIKELHTSLQGLTNKVLGGFPEMLADDLASINQLEANFHKITERAAKTADWKAKLGYAKELIDDCHVLGVPQFIRMARCAFISGSLLRSLVSTKAVAQADIDKFMRSISTVATQIDVDFSKMRRGRVKLRKFMETYGHLRPGTYDITKLPYTKNPSYVKSSGKVNQKLTKSTMAKPFSKEKLHEKMIKRLHSAAKKERLTSSGEDILRFIITSIENREYFKFVYTKNISSALELIADVGNYFGLTRADMAHLNYYSIIGLTDHCNRGELKNIWHNLLESRREEKRLNNMVSLPPIIFSSRDIFVVPSYISTPNFITDSSVEGDVVSLDNGKPSSNIEEKIVILEKADPGYDWIFTKNIKALITKYGGAASHMAIRCAEFNIPAAIGCGNLIYDNIVNCNKLVISCKNKTITPLQ